MTNEDIFVNRKLWDDIFTALRQHLDSHAKYHSHSNILCIQMDILYKIHEILSNTLEACNNKPLHTTYTVLPK